MENAAWKIVHIIGSPGCFFIECQRSHFFVPVDLVNEAIRKISGKVNVNKEGFMYDFIRPHIRPVSVFDTVAGFFTQIYTLNEAFFFKACLSNR